MIKIACIGDSITWGFTILRRGAYSYPAVLQRLLKDKAQVANFGLNDSTASRESEMPYTKRPPFSKAKAFGADLALIMLGSNDTKKINWGEEKFREGYSYIVDTFLQQGARVYLMLPPAVLNRIELKEGVQIGRLEPKFLALNEDILRFGVIPAIKDIAQEKNLPVIDLHSLITDISLFNDGIHPNKEGAALMANAIAQRLKEDSVI